MKSFSIALLIAFFEIATQRLLATTVQSQANVPVEITFTASLVHEDPFNTVQVDVEFTDPEGQRRLVPAFWDSRNIWKVRYASPLIGTHHFKSQCNVATDPGLNGKVGTVIVSKYGGNNPLYAHGPIQVASDRRHFQYADGTPFFWLGDTWWMGLCHRLHWPTDVKTLAADRKQKGFTVIQIVAGLYPDMHPFDPRGGNEAGFPWETNYTAIRPQYFDRADQRLRYLIDEGFTPCIVGAWGYFLPWMGEERAKQHWRELIARYGSWPVVWCVAGEANLPWYLAKGFPYDDRELVHGWTRVARYIRDTDPYHRPLTIHPTGIGKLNARWAIDDASLIDFDMLQTPHGEREAVAPTIAAFKHAYELPPMPVVNGEASYENLNGRIPAEWPRAMFWLCMINGAAGHTYGANGIWQVNRHGQPHGASPHGGNYGTIAWDDAMKLPGSQQIGAGKKFLSQFPWYQCTPQNNTVSIVEQGTANWGDWIWYPEADPKVDAPVEPRFFRGTFEISDVRKVKRGILKIGVDNSATVWVNNKRVGNVSGWQGTPTFEIAPYLIKGKNVIAIEATNEPAPVKLNPAGLITALGFVSDHQVPFVPEVTRWRVTKTVMEGWRDVSFNDSEWSAAMRVAAANEGPWGPLNSADSYSPFAMGISDELRIVYALSPVTVQVKNLKPNGAYNLSEFDPVTGRVNPKRVAASALGEITLPAPNHGHDSVVALELIGTKRKRP